jgi:hypothetical protein
MKKPLISRSCDTTRQSVPKHTHTLFKPDIVLLPTTLTSQLVQTIHLLISMFGASSGHLVSFIGSVLYSQIHPTPTRPPQESHRVEQSIYQCLDDYAQYYTNQLRCTNLWSKHRLSVKPHALKYTNNSGMQRTWGDTSPNDPRRPIAISCPLTALHYRAQISHVRSIRPLTAMQHGSCAAMIQRQSVQRLSL